MTTPTLIDNTLAAGARRTRALLACLAMLTLLPVPIQATELCAQSAPKAAQKAAIRGVWVASPDHNRFFDSQATMQSQMRAWREQGINTLFVAMWNQGRTMYPSQVVESLTGVSIDARFAGRDPLQEVIAVARKEGLMVYAWFEFGFATDYQGGLGSELLEKRPRWAALDQHGKHVIKNGFRWMNALDPEVQDFVLRVVTEVVDRYDVDGVQGDDRLPAMPSEGGYDKATVARYAKDHAGAAPPRNSKDPKWLEWRAQILNQFVQRLHSEVKRRKPSVQISMSPSPFPWGRDEYLQDWPTWLRNGWVDSVSPQIYRYNLAAYQTELQKISREQVCPAQLHQVFPGILLALGSEYVAPLELLTAQVRANRAEGIRGEVFFHSEGMRKRADYFGTGYPSTWKP
ncbi:MAG: family 10 glycosylhydrolase [Rhodoferax sp.]|nr:family 10 glycosylhydrolase [Rhodoferax sp.]